MRPAQRSEPLMPRPTRPAEPPPLKPRRQCARPRSSARRRLQRRTKISPRWRSGSKPRCVAPAASRRPRTAIVRRRSPPTPHPRGPHVHRRRSPRHQPITARRDAARTVQEPRRRDGELARPSNELDVRRAPSARRVVLFLTFILGAALFSGLPRRRTSASTSVAAMAASPSARSSWSRCSRSCRSRRRSS